MCNFRSSESERGNLDIWDLDIAQIWIGIVKGICMGFGLLKVENYFEIERMNLL